MRITVEHYDEKWSVETKAELADEIVDLMMRMAIAIGFQKKSIVEGAEIFVNENYESISEL